MNNADRFDEYVLVPSNIPLDDLARRCVKGRTSRVILEPGDMTRYEFYIVPFKNPRLRMSGTNENFALLAPVSPVVGSAYPFDFYCTPHWGYVKSHMRSSEHVARIFTGFWEILAEKVRELEANGNKFTVED